MWPVSSERQIWSRTAWVRVSRRTHPAHPAQRISACRATGSWKMRNRLLRTIPIRRPGLWFDIANDAIALCHQIVSIIIFKITFYVYCILHFANSFYFEMVLYIFVQSSIAVYTVLLNIITHFRFLKFFFK